MPTVSNRDLNGHWSECEGMVQDSFGSKRFEEGRELSVAPDTHSSESNNIAEEHRYAVTQRFISSNSYYGYHPVLSHGHAEVEDCPMERSDAAAVSDSNSTRSCETADWQVSRKRCFDGGVDLDEGITVGKRIRYDSFQEGVPPCAPWPNPSPQSHPQLQQLESPMSRTRCLMGHYV